MQLPPVIQNLSPKHKRLAVIAGLVVVIVLGGLMFSGDRPRRTAQPKDDIVKHILSDRDTREVSIEALAAQIKMLADEKNQMAAELERLKNERTAAGGGREEKHMTEQAKRLEIVVADLSKKIEAMEAAQGAGAVEGEPRPARTAPPPSGEPLDPKDVFNAGSMRATGSSQMYSPDTPAPTTPGGAPSETAVTGGIRLVNAESVTGAEKHAKDKKGAKEERSGADPSRNARKERAEGPIKEGEAYLPTGSIISGTLLTGIDAPTGQGARRDPAPALLRIKKEAILPNRYRADIRECFALVGGYGDLSSERAYLRGESISCVKNDGSIIESKLAGYTVGSDGKAGVRGRLVTKQGQLIARAMMAGFIKGVGEAFSYTPVPTLQTSPSGKVDYMQQLSPEAIQSAGMSGVGDAMDRIAKFYIDMAEGMYPVIEIDAGRTVEFVLNGGLRLKVI